MDIQSDIQLNKSKELLIAATDIGNSRIKLLIGNKSLAVDYESDWESQVIDCLSHFINSKIVLGLSSVSITREETFKDICHNFKNIQLMNASDYFCQQNILNLQQVQGCGTDRIFGMFGALSYGNAPLITIDCGTAITINAVGTKNEFIGGAIFAGVQTQIAGLHNKTAALPQFDSFFTRDEIGNNTINAIMSGVLRAVVGGIKEVVSQIIKTKFHRQQPNIYITGGTAKMILDLLYNGEFDFQYKEHLVLEGVINLLKNAKFIQSNC